MKRIRYHQSFHETNPSGISEEKFKAGSHYEISEETRRHEALGYAEEVDVEEEPAAERQAGEPDQAETAAPARRGRKAAAAAPSEVG